jgi:hypothetical protein
MTGTANDPGSLRRRGLAWAVIAIVAIGLVARGWAIHRIPGINGDEAWFGANLQAWSSGLAVFWTTPSGNPINPLHSGPLGLLMMWFAPSAALLRAPELLLAIVSLAIAYPLLRRSIGPHAALLSTMLLAASPVAIAYARLGWDPSDTPPVTLLALGLALNNRPIAAALAGLIVIVVHPTNIFFMPVLLGAWAPHGVRWYAAATPSGRRRAALAGAAAVGLLAVATAVVLIQAANNPNTPLPPLSVAIGRVFSVTAWVDLWRGIARMWAGITTASFVAGEPSAWLTSFAEITGLAALAASLLGRRWTHVAAHRAWLLGGIGIGVVMFMLAGGPDPLARPGYERYAVSLLVPLIVTTALGIEALFGNRSGLVALLMSGALLFVAGAGYFAPLVTDGGTRAEFRTGIVEPKQAAADFIHSEAPAGALVICHDWWSYWPIRFLVGDNASTIVTIAPGANLPPGVRERLPIAPPNLKVPVFEVAFEGGEGWKELSSDVPAFTARDPKGRPILHVFRMN